MSLCHPETCIFHFPSDDARFGQMSLEAQLLHHVAVSSSHQWIKGHVMQLSHEAWLVIRRSRYLSLDNFA